MPLLAILAGVVCACYFILSVADKYYSAQSALSMYKQDLQGWDACRVMKPAFFKANAEAVSQCLSNLADAQDDFWVNLPKAQLVGLYISAALGGAAGGYLAVWTVVQLVTLAVHKFIGGIVHAFCRGTSGRVKGADAIPSQATQ